jgi:hypothetical protein
MVDADKAAGVADETTQYLLIQDNLDAQDAGRNPPYIDALTAAQTDDHKVQLDPPRPPRPLIAQLVSML